MLIIKENVKEYFEQTEEWAREAHILHLFNEAMTRCHLYGCSWTDPERARVVLYAQDFADYSFLFEIQFRQSDNTYRHFMSGGLIFHGKTRNGRLIDRSEHVGWNMHT